MKYLKLEKQLNKELDNLYKAYKGFNPEYFYKSQKLHYAFSENVKKLFKENKNEFKEAVEYMLNNYEYFYSENDEQILEALTIDEQFLRENKLEQTYQEAVNEYMDGVERLISGS